MDILSFLEEASTCHGPSGQERPVALWLAERFRPFTDSVTIDPLFNVIACKKATKATGHPPVKIMLCAHQDEIALMVTDILPDGALRIGQVGGVDPRILPASTVAVHATGAEGGTILGVVGAKPPHLLSAEDRQKNYLRDELFVDIGFSAEKARELVNIGDLITLEGRAVALLNGHVAGKTMDDRSCIAIMLDAAERLQAMSHEADVYFVCSSQEEVGGHGAKAAAYTIDPDLAIVLDVTHAEIPSSSPDTCVPLGAPALTYGPFIQHKLLDKMKETAKKHRITINDEHANGATWTDTDSIQIAREGIPCVLIGLPLKYMHTTVELLDTHVIEECGRLAAHFIQSIQEGWDEGLWS